MDKDLEASILLIESNQKENNEFGTGFIVHQDKQATFVLTCAHVVEILGKDHIRVDDRAATIVAIGASDNLDLAILSIRGLSNQPRLKLLVTGKKGDLVKIIGFQVYGKQRLRKDIRGQLGGQGSLRKPKTRG